MKLFSICLIIATALILPGCASQDAQHQGRFIASVDQGCRLEKKDGRDHYRVLLDGKPYNGYWYGYSDAAGLLQRLEDKGRCDY